MEKFFKGYGIQKSQVNDDSESNNEDITPVLWLANVRSNNAAIELNGLNNPRSWKNICDFLEIDVGQDSAHRRLEQWLQRNKPHWPSTF